MSTPLLATEAFAGSPPPVPSRAMPDPFEGVFSVNSVSPRNPAGVPPQIQAPLSAKSANTFDYGIFGPLNTLVTSPKTTDVLVCGYKNIWIDQGQGLERVPFQFSGERQLRSLAVSLISAGGRHIDDACPYADVHLGNGIRVHAIFPPIAVGGVQLSIRVPSQTLLDFSQLIRQDMFDTATAKFLAKLISARKNLLITGATGSGKTTLLRALLQLAPPDQRIICVEDVAELHIKHPHVVQLETRQPNAEHIGGVDMDLLLRQALRMRPDRVVVGECRGPELIQLMSALNTGHQGGAGTLHANSVPDVPARLEAMGQLGDMSPDALASQAVSAFDVLLHVAKTDGHRVLQQVGKLSINRRGRLSAQRITDLPAFMAEIDSGSSLEQIDDQSNTLQEGPGNGGENV